MLRYLFVLSIAVAFGAAAYAQGPVGEAPLLISDDGHMFVRASINGTEPLIFGLDSGFEQTAITAKQAKALGLKTFGETKVSGVGEGEDDIAFARNVRFE